MKWMNRREFVVSATAGAASLRMAAQNTAKAVLLTMHPEQPMLRVPNNFIGLSYETQQLAEPAFFSVHNKKLVEKFRWLGERGVLRLGGNTSDVGWWKAGQESLKPELPPAVFIVPPKEGQRPFQDLAYPVTPAAVKNLREFLVVAGWTCIYGLNLGTSTPGRAAEEAAFVAETLGLASDGGKLEYFQLGNEPDFFQGRFRDRATWGLDMFLEQWLAGVKAVRRVVPGAKFGLPDTGEHPEWNMQIAERFAALPDHSFVAAITHHHYFGGPPTNPDVTVENMLRPDARMLLLAENARAAAAKLGCGYRLTEGNSCWGGGKPGLSDVYAASLWGADTLLTLASHGYAGVNFHGGGDKTVSDSLGGTLKGDELVHDDLRLHPRPYYTPLAAMHGEIVVEPVAYGIKFAAAFTGATMIPVDFNPREVNATTYAARFPDGKTVVAVINKDVMLPLTVELIGETAMVRRLTAKALQSHEVSFAEAGELHKAKTGAGGEAKLLAVVVPAISAALITLRG